MDCPRCRGPLDDSGPSAMCHACRGVWVNRASLAEMIAEMVGDEAAELPLVPRGTTTPPLECPKCGQSMAAMSLEEVDVDDCPPHGIWLDADELASVLRRARRRVVDGG